MRVCKKCQQNKELEEYRLVTEKRTSKVKTPIQYPCSWCKTCEKQQAREAYHRNREQRIFVNKKYKLEHSEELKQKRREYLEKTKQHVRHRYKAYCEKNRETLNKNAQIYIKNNIHQKLRRVFSSRLRECLKKQKNTINYMGDSFKNIALWLEYNMQDFMSWDNYGKEWNIDHVLPITLFDMSDDDDVFVCFSWMNLRPIKKEDNIKKSNKVERCHFDRQVDSLHAYSLLYPELTEKINKYLELYLERFETLTCTIMQHDQIAGTPLSPLVPLFLGNLKEEHR